MLTGVVFADVVSKNPNYLKRGKIDKVHIANYKKKELDSILEKISPIINAYMEKKSVKILLDSKNILIGRSNLNLTNEVINEINDKIK